MHNIPIPSIELQLTNNGGGTMFSSLNGSNKGVVMP